MISVWTVDLGPSVYNLSVAYYFSIVAIALFVLIIYILKLDLWPTPEKPKTSLLFSIFGNIWLALNLLAAIYLSLVNPKGLFFTGLWWKIVAILLGLFGAGLSLWAWVTFKTVRRLLGMEINLLVTWGPYRYTRHPQYFSIMLITVALAILFNTIQLLLFAVSTTVTFYIVAIMEENKLEKIFGLEYQRYKARVPRFIPFLKVVRKQRGSM